MLPPALVKKFPKLSADGAQKTSEASQQYNCIAWSAKRDKEHWWEPKPQEPWDYWPQSIPDDYSFESFVLIFEKRGYKKCGLDSRFEFFYKKVALYADTEGFTHVCDQLNSGAWWSKLAADEDIQHNSLEALEGSIGNEYGKVQQVLKKRCWPWELLARVIFKLKEVFRKRANMA
jgi:hypothetical protein